MLLVWRCIYDRGHGDKEGAARNGEENIRNVQSARAKPSPEGGCRGGGKWEGGGGRG